MESLLQERENQGDMEEIGGLVGAGERERERSQETWKRGGHVTAEELQGDGDPRRHGRDITAGEGDPRRHGGEVESLPQERYTQGDMEERWSRYCRRGRSQEKWRRLVESLL